MSLFLRLASPVLSDALSHEPLVPRAVPYCLASSFVLPCILWSSRMHVLPLTCPLRVCVVYREGRLRCVSPCVTAFSKSDCLPLFIQVCLRWVHVDTGMLLVFDLPSCYYLFISIVPCCFSSLHSYNSSCALVLVLVRLLRISSCNHL